MDLQLPVGGKMVCLTNLTNMPVGSAATQRLLSRQSTWGLFEFLNTVSLWRKGPVRVGKFANLASRPLYQGAEEAEDHRRGP